MEGWLTSVTKVDLFERGAEQAARAVSETRIGHIANVVARGLDGDEQAEIECRRVLQILAELDDDQLIMLAARLQKNSGEYLERHKAVVIGPLVNLGSDEGEWDRAALHEAAASHLVRLNLLKASFPWIREGEIPEFDDTTGKIRSSGDDITQLGRIVLRAVGLAELGDY